MDKRIYCFGVQRAATTSIYEDILTSLKIRDVEVKEKASLFNGKEIPEGCYLSRHKGYHYGSLFLDFTPEYSIYLDRIQIPLDEYFKFLILRRPSKRIISHWKKHCNEVSRVSLDEFINENVDRCVDRSRYSNFISELRAIGCRIYFLEQDLDKLYKDLSDYLGAEVKINSQSNASIEVPKFMLPLYRIIARGNPKFQYVLRYAGVKLLYRRVVRPYFRINGTTSIKDETECFLEELDKKESRILHEMGYANTWYDCE